VNILEFIRIFLELFGAGWLLLIILIAIFGGSFLVQLENPFTQKMESITDVSINHENKISAD
jgi:hypothetical protein